MSLTVEIASVPDRDHWVGEIWDGPNMIVEIARREDGTPTIEIYPRRDAKSVKLDFAEFYSSLLEIKAKLGV